MTSVGSQLASRVSAKRMTATSRDTWDDRGAKGSGRKCRGAYHDVEALESHIWIWSIAAGVRAVWPPLQVSSGVITAVMHSCPSGSHVRSSCPCCGSAREQLKCPEEFVLGSAGS